MHAPPPRHIDCSSPRLGVGNLFLFFSSFPLFSCFFFLASLLLLTSKTCGNGNGRSGLILIGLTILPSGVTFHPPRPSTFSGVTRDMSSACVPPARLRRFLGGSAAFSRSRSSLSGVLDYEHIFHADKEQKKTNRSAKSGLASPILNFAPFHVEPFNKIKPTSSHQSQTYKINEKLTSC